MKFDDLIIAEAAAAGVEPALLKALVRKESSFDPDAINPEVSYTLEGKKYGPKNKTGRARLVFLIKAGHDPEEYGLNPSVGLVQTRVATANDVLPGVTAQELFDPQTSLRAGARFLRSLFDRGITLETVDAYNVGFHGLVNLGRRNFDYRNKVNRYYREFKGKI